MTKHNGPRPGRQPLADAVLRLVSGWSGVLLALCLLFPIAWNRAFPQLDPETLHVAVTDFSADASELPQPVVSARRVDEGFAKGMFNGDGAFPLKRESIRAVFQVDLAGRYSIYGISSNDRAHPLQIAFNRRSVSAMAFYENTGALHGRLETHRIATGVALFAGDNEVTLIGPELERRTVILSLRRERPLSPLFALLMFALAVAVSLGGSLLARRVRLSARTRLIATATLVLFILIALPLWVYSRSGRDLVSLGHKTPELLERLGHMDRYVADRFEADHDNLYRVAVFGDSTHYLLLEDDQHMVPTLRRALPEDLRDEVAYFGTAIGGMSAWDFYLMLNRVASLQPDLVILPVNGSSFSEAWMRNEGYHLEVLDRHLAFAEYPRAFGLSVRGRTFSWTRMLHQRLDDVLFAGQAGPFLRGTKVYFEDEQQRLSDNWGGVAEAGLTPQPPPRDVADLPWGAEDVGPDHELFAVFDLINDFAARRGIDILYYNVSEQALEQGGDGPVTAAQDMDTILEIVGRGDTAHVERFPSSLPPRMFTDRWIHLTPDGIEQVATQLNQRVLQLRGQP